MKHDRDARKEAPDRCLILLKMMTFFLVFAILHGLACRSGPEHNGQSSPVATARDGRDRHETTPVRSSTPTLSALRQPDYRISNIPARPDSVRGNLDRRPARNWKYIVIHHSGTESGNMQSFDRTARTERGWKGVGYHFVIGNGSGSGDGTVEVTFRWEEQIHGAHAGVEEYNEYGIGICLVGNFDTGYPTEKQLIALASLTGFLQDRNDIPTSEIWLHRGVKNTACPGRNFPFYKFLSLLRR